MHRAACARPSKARACCPQPANTRCSNCASTRRSARKPLPSGARDRTFQVIGGDERGLIYGALALREQLLDGVAIDAIADTTARPALAFRGIKFNTPWDTYRPSSALDQHYDTARDLKFWERFLDMMVENRFNAVSLWTMHPFTYMIRPKNFPEAGKWTPQQFAEWQHLYHEIFRMAKERGLDTYVVFWSIFVSEEFAKAHGVAKENFYPHYYVPGDTSPTSRNATCAKAWRRCSRSIPISTASASRMAKAWPA